MAVSPAATVQMAMLGRVSACACIDSRAAVAWRRIASLTGDEKAPTSSARQRIGTSQAC